MLEQVATPTQGKHSSPLVDFLELFMHRYTVRRCHRWILSWQYP